MISRDEQAYLVRAWHASQDATSTPQAQQMIAAEQARIHQAFRELPIQVQFVDHDPYQSFEQMRDQVQSTGQMLVYKGSSETPLWTPHTNWMARAVHDWDHIVRSCDFSMEGEAAAFRHAAACRPGLAPLYLSEIMLQAAIANYEGAFVPQKLVLAPENVQRRAATMRGVEADPQAELVWSTSGILRVSTPEMAMVHLAAKGVGPEDALVIVVAAQMLNNEVDAEAATPLRGLGAGHLLFGEPVLDVAGTASLAKMKLRAKNDGTLQGAIVSAAYHAKKHRQPMYVWQGNSYMHAVWNVSTAPSRSPTENIGDRVFKVTPDLQLYYQVDPDRCDHASITDAHGTRCRRCGVDC